MASKNIAVVLYFLVVFTSFLCRTFPCSYYIRNWSPWSACSISQCGQLGIQTRFRSERQCDCNLHPGCRTIIIYRQNRHCYGTAPVNCKVISWSSWSPCSAVQCGKSGFQRRSRTVITNPGCGGTACPSNMNESQMCYGTATVNCIYSAWSNWSACPPSRCGDSQISIRYIITREQCGGTPCNMTALRKERACKQSFCVNQGTLFNGECSCKPGYYGSCCQYNSK